MGLSYKEAGVDIQAGYESVKQLTKEVKKTFNKSVLDNFGSFGALYMPNLKGMKQPVLVSSTDGVGTKLLLAIELEIFETIGIDLVAMCVNDIITQGAKPLFMLDYIALHKLEPALVTSIIKGIVEGCKQANCALIGGETAEMRDVYKKGDFDLAGFTVGIVDKSKIITGKGVKEGDVLMALPSSGVHSNGYSLARKIADLVTDKEENIKLKKELLKPTIIYVKEVLALIKKYKLKAIANITGGGLYENIARVLPTNLNAVVDISKWKKPEIFTKLQSIGQVSDREMYNTFNMGMGMCFVVSKSTAEDISKKHKSIMTVGYISKGTGEVVVEGINA